MGTTPAAFPPTHSNRGGHGSGMRGGGNFGRGAGPDAHSSFRGNARGGYSGNQAYNGGRESGYSNSGPQMPYNNRGGGYNNGSSPPYSQFNNRGRGGYQGVGPRGPPSKATDPSAMEVLGLAPPERAAPPPRPGPENPGWIHPAHQEKVRQMQREMEQQQQQQVNTPQQQYNHHNNQQNNYHPQQRGGQGQGRPAPRVSSPGMNRDGNMDSSALTASLRATITTGEGFKERRENRSPQIHSFQRDRTGLLRVGRGRCTGVSSALKMLARA